MWIVCVLSLVSWLVSRSEALCFPNGTVVVVGSTVLDAQDTLFLTGCPADPTTTSMCDEYTTLQGLEAFVPPVYLDTDRPVDLVDRLSDYQTLHAFDTSSLGRLEYDRTAERWQGNVVPRESPNLSPREHLVTAITETESGGSNPLLSRAAHLESINSVAGTPLVLLWSQDTPEAPLSEQSDMTLDLMVCLDAVCENTEFTRLSTTSGFLTKVRHPSFVDQMVGMAIVLHWYSGHPMVWAAVLQIDDATLPYTHTLVLHRWLCEAPVQCLTPAHQSWSFDAEPDTAAVTKWSNYMTLALSNQVSNPERPRLLVLLRHFIHGPFTVPDQELYIYDCADADCSVLVEHALTPVTLQGLYANIAREQFDSGGLQVRLDHGTGLTYVVTSVHNTVTTYPNVADPDVTELHLVLKVCDLDQTLACGATTVQSLQQFNTTSVSAYDMAATGVAVLLSDGGQLEIFACPNYHEDAVTTELRLVTTRESDSRDVLAPSTPFTEQVLLGLASLGERCSGNVVALENRYGLPSVIFGSGRDALNHELRVMTCLDRDCRTDTSATQTRSLVLDPGTTQSHEQFSAHLGSNGFPVIVTLDSTNQRLYVVECGEALCQSYGVNYVP